MNTPLLWLTGPPCVGKSAVGWELLLQIMRAGTKAAYVDLEQIGFACPTIDPERLRARNVQAMWTNFRAVGARVLVVSGAVPGRDAFQGYIDRLPDTAPRVYRLRARPDTLTARVFRRGQGIDPALPGDQLLGCGDAALRRKAEEAVRVAAALEWLRVDEVCVDTDDQTSSDVASLIRGHAGL